MKYFCLYNSTCLLLAFTASLLASAASLSAQDANDSIERDQRLAEMKRQAAEYIVALTTSSPVELKLHEEPLLRFDNPVGGVPDGIVMMWKEGSRPAILAQVFKTADGLWIHECQSLASDALRMERNGTVVWSPAKGASDFRPLPKAPPPADSAVKRLVQMKRIAAEFSAADDFKIRPGDVEYERNQLRLLPTPVYRYSDAKQGIADAAVFAFVHGTDPELFLVLEQRTDERKKQGWHYALVPMTCWAVDAEHGGKQVWNAPERLKSKPNEDYHVWVYRPK